MKYRILGKKPWNILDKSIVPLLSSQVTKQPDLEFIFSYHGRDRANGANMGRLLILGGTGEARALAAAVTNWEGLTVISSLAGRTKSPQLPVGEVRRGGFGGVEGLVAYLRSHHIDWLIDATHPFAAQMSAQGQQAATCCEIPYLRLERPPWQPVAGDYWLRVGSHEGAVALLPSLGERFFLTIGRQEVHHYRGIPGAWFLLRSIDPPEPHHMPAGELLLAQGPFEVVAERELLQRYGIGAVVSKNSGGPETYGKIAAARELGLPVVMIDRPAGPDAQSHVGQVVDEVESAVSWLRRQL